MPKPTILVVYEMLGGEANGALIFSLMLKKALQQQGYHVPFLTARYPSYPLEAEEVFDLPWTGLPWSRHRFVRYWPPIKHQVIVNIADSIKKS